MKASKMTREYTATIRCDGYQAELEINAISVDHAWEQAFLQAWSMWPDREIEVVAVNARRFS
jgi:hypothetical protein